jgi:hypothetical protein
MVAVSIKSITSAANATAAATFTCTTSETPAVTLVGDLVVVLHSNDFYALTNMSTPSATGSPTMNSIGSVDGGSNEGHTTAWWYLANTGGAQTVTATETGVHDEEKALVVIVLSGADTASPIDGTPASTFNVTGSTSHTIPSISPATSTAYEIVIDATGGGNAASSYSAPSYTGSLYFSISTFFSGEIFTRQLAASGATGTTTITTVGGGNTFVLAFAIKTATGGAAPTPRQTIVTRSARIRASYW